MTGSKKIILFDGVCNLCHSAVQFVIRRDSRDRFLFASLQSEAARELLKRFDWPPQDLDSFVVIDGDRMYTRSSAALFVLKQLPFAWNLLYAGIIIPRFIRDAVYKWVAKHRYQWFGKKEACWVPTPALKAKFLS